MSVADRITTSRLANDAKAYVLESRSNITVDLIGYLEGGLGLEASQQAGVANLCVGTLDRGTRTRAHDEIAEALESCGARVSFDLTPETTTFRARCLSEDLALVLSILAECLAAPSFPEAQLKIGREEALAGLREAAIDTYARAYECGAGLVLGADHPYARDPLGRDAVVPRVTAEQVHAFHRRLLSSSRLRLAVIGDVSVDEVTTLLEETLGSLPPVDERSHGGALPDEGREAASTVAPTAGSAAAPADASVDVSVDASAGGPHIGQREHLALPDKEQVDLFFMRRGVPRTAPDFEAYALANFLVGGSFLSRLNQRLRDQEGLTYGAQSTIVSGLEAGLWYAYVSVHPRDVERCVEMTFAELARFAAEGPADDELEMARLHLTGSFPIKLEAKRVVASVLLDSVRTGRGLDYIDRYCERVMAIGRGQVIEAARGLWLGAPMTVASAGASLPAGTGR